MALVVSLLDTTLIRIGNRQYLRENNSYGLTTLRNRHVQVQGSTVRFQFRGKRGVEHDVSLRDRRLARLIKRCLELPGQTLFQYLDEQGQRHAVGSSEVNQFLQQLTGADFTAKDYRTWAGSALALDLLRPWPGNRKARPAARLPLSSGRWPRAWAIHLRCVDAAISTRRCWSIISSADWPPCPKPGRAKAWRRRKPPYFASCNY